MRIKIIGDNNCARATRYFLRTAGFAVTEYLPVEAITQAPHSGYAITIDVATVPSSGNTPDPSGEFFGSQESRNALGESLTSMPEYSTLGQPADAHGEVSAALDENLADASSLALAGGDEDCAMSDCGEGAEGSARLRCSVGVSKATPAEAYAAGGAGGGGGIAGHIHFDSVDSELEAAVLRHVTQLAAMPVIVDRPGGKVRSERELRLVVPLAKNARGELCMDDAAAVAVELGVLRGLLDMVSPAAASAKAEKSGTGAGDAGLSASGAGRRKKKWWGFGCFLILMGALSLSMTAEAAPRTAPSAAGATLTPTVTRSSTVTSANGAARRAGTGLARSVEGRGAEGEYLHLVAALPSAAASAATPMAVSAEAASAAILAPTGVLFPAAMVRGLAPDPAPAQGQFATGQPTRITDGTNTLVVDPCKGQARQFVSINQTGNTQLLAGTASKKIYICSIHVVVAAATSIAVVEGTGSVCGTGTAGVSGFGGATAATGWNFAANGGIAFGNGEASIGAEGTAADNLCLFNSGSGQVSGGIGYVVQ